MSCSLVGATQDINLQKGSLVYGIYGKCCISERFNCNYSINDQYSSKLQDSELQFVGWNSERNVRIVELPKHQFFLAMLFQPQLISTENHPHPVIVAYLSAVKTYH